VPSDLVAKLIDAVGWIHQRSYRSREST
jgi:hypothetical protein